MSSLRTHTRTGNLFFDFRYQGVRCREYTAVPSTAANRKKLQKVLDRIETDITMGRFNYSDYFPSSNMADRFEKAVVKTSTTSDSIAPDTPSFKDFAEQWFTEKEVEWRNSYRDGMRSTLDIHLLPAFAERPVGAITKRELMAYRSELAKRPGLAGRERLSTSRVNHIINPLRMILTEASDRFDFANPMQGVKSLKVPRTDVDPFTLDEVKLIINSVRADFRAYYTVRFFTAMRTAEVDGLQWQYVDFDRKQILIRETIVRRRIEKTKTPESHRAIEIAPVVEAALREQEKLSRHRSKFVFCANNGAPVYHHNVTNRVWYPLLRHLDLKLRRPYQTRHTAATLWLAAGESPEWIARQMGHTTTEMLFRVYSRFVPNLTRQDGSAMNRLLAANGLGLEATAEDTDDE